jgi:hypothetical protein
VASSPPEAPLEAKPEAGAEAHEASAPEAEQPAQPVDARPTPVPAGDEARPDEDQATVAPTAEVEPKKRKGKKRSPDKRQALQEVKVAAEALADEPAGASEPPPLELDVPIEAEPSEPPPAPSGVDVLNADDLAEMIDVEDAAPDESQETSAPAKTGTGKRSVPPPLPRG